MGISSSIKIRGHFLLTPEILTIMAVTIYPSITPSGDPSVRRVNIIVLLLGSVINRLTQTGKYMQKKT